MEKVVSFTFDTSYISEQDIKKALEKLNEEFERKFDSVVYEISITNK